LKSDISEENNAPLNGNWMILAQSRNKFDNCKRWKI